MGVKTLVIGDVGTFTCDVEDASTAMVRIFCTLSASLCGVDRLAGECVSPPVSAMRGEGLRRHRSILDRGR